MIIGTSRSMWSLVIAVSFALKKQRLALVSTSAKIASPVTCTGKYSNEFPLNANAFSFSVISLEGPVSFLADGHR